MFVTLNDRPAPGPSSLEDVGVPTVPVAVSASAISRGSRPGRAKGERRGGAKTNPVRLEEWRSIEGVVWNGNGRDVHGADDRPSGRR